MPAGPRLSTLKRRVNELRRMLAEYQRSAGVASAEAVGELISPLAADIEDLQQGIELGVFAEEGRTIVGNDLPKKERNS